MTKLPWPKQVYEHNSQIYKILANAKRLEILNLIEDREVTVQELSDVLGIRKANTSQHLAILRAFKLVTVRRDGQRAYYKIADPDIVAPCKIFKHLWENKTFPLV